MCVIGLTAISSGCAPLIGSLPIIAYGEVAFMTEIDAFSLFATYTKLVAGSIAIPSSSLVCAFLSITNVPSGVKMPL